MIVLDRRVSASGSFAIENASVFTGSGFSGPQTVLVTNGEIVTVGRASVPGGHNCGWVWKISYPWPD